MVLIFTYHDICMLHKAKVTSRNTMELLAVYNFCGICQSTLILPCDIISVSYRGKTTVLLLVYEMYFYTKLLRQDTTGIMVTDSTTLNYSRYIKTIVIFYKVSEMLCLNMYIILYLIKCALISIHFQNGNLSIG